MSTEPSGARHTASISNRPGEITASERLARRWWAIVAEEAFDQLADLVHEDVVVVSKIRPGLVLEGKREVVHHMHETLAGNLHEATTTAYLPIDEDRIVVEGRIRWIDDDRVIRDDPVTWAMEFRDGLLVRFIPARTQVEAETILGAPVP
ncbi:MAG: nuclear transport factor 2 family protein [Gaiellaceae bacterium]